MKSALSIKILTTTIIITALPFHAYAETSSSPIVVTASRTSETVDDSLASVSVITREDIENSQAREVADLLKLEAGIDLSKNGGPGALTNVFTRGANSNHTLFLIDGMRVSSATTGTFSLERLTLNDIERIEIVRGPRSTQYGSEAIGGIIHIFTRKHESMNARIGAGSFGTRQASAGLVLGKKTVLRLGGSYEQARGFSATNPNAGFFYNADDDGYRKNNYNLSFSTPLSDSIKLELVGWGSNSQTEFDQGVSDAINQDFIANFKQQVSASWSHKLSIGYNYENIITTSGFPSDITTRRTQIDWQHDIVLSDKLLLLAGFTRYEDKAQNIDTGTPTTFYDQSIDNNAIFTNLSYSGDTHSFLFSIREDDHSAFGSETTGLVSWGMRLTPDMHVTATISNAFRAPSINELYHPGFDYGGGPLYAGNPDLKPETSDGGELSFRWAINKQQKLNVTYFSNWINNLIAYEGTNFQAINIAQARTKGLELQYTLAKDKWSLNTNLTLQRAYDEETKLDLIRRPREKLGMTLGYDHSNDAHTRLEVLYSASRLDGSNKEFELPSYTIFNLATRIKIDRQVWVDARMDNITNKQYELARGFNTPDRSVFLGISYQAE
ncbi:MAG: TonB-dependent receptor [Thioalkalispiraceae bacterium]|jgi:vitamin B12 transporter